MLTPILSAAALLAALAAAEPAGAAPGASAVISGAGKAGGTATLQEGPQGVVMKLELSGLTPGWHAIHFHEKADCSDPKFQSAGGHINHAEAKKPHGLLNPAGPDFGDLPNIHVGADGKAQVQVYSQLVSLNGAGGRPALLDANGSSILVHANADDYMTQPIGGAGDRVACGAITSGAQ